MFLSMLMLFDPCSKAPLGLGRHIKMWRCEGLSLVPLQLKCIFGLLHLHLYFVLIFNFRITQMCKSIFISFFSFHKTTCRTYFVHITTMS